MSSFRICLRPAARASSFWIIINFLLRQFKNVVYLNKLIMMQKLEPRTVGLRPKKIGHVDRVIQSQKALAESRADKATILR